MRVLLISHTCQSPTEGQPKAEHLARFADVDLRVLVPDRWLHYGAWRSPALATESARAGPSNNSSRPAYEVGRVRFPWTGPGQFYLHFYPRLRRVLESFRPDVIDLWEEPWGLVSAHACLLRNRVLPTAKIVSETEQNIDKVLPFPFERFRRYTLRNADFAVGRSAEAVAVLRSKGYAGPAEVVPNGVDAELFRPMGRDACRRELGVSGFVAGYVGRLVEEKGLADLIDALPNCPADVNVVFVGGGPIKEALENRARTLGVGGRVRVLPARPLAELPGVMNALDAFVLPSRTTGRWKEQFGRVLIEAQACKVPVVGSSSGAIPDVVGEAGLVVPERDPRSLSAALTRLRDQPDEARRMAEAGRKQVEERYTWGRVAARMRDIYAKLVSAQ